MSDDVLLGCLDLAGDVVQTGALRAVHGQLDVIDAEWDMVVASEANGQRFSSGGRICKSLYLTEPGTARESRQRVQLDFFGDG